MARMDILTTQGVRLAHYTLAVRQNDREDEERSAVRVHYSVEKSNPT